MLHTSALDDHHAVPTTAQITEAAHKTASMGSRVFPSAGLNIAQVCEAIKENDLSPILFNGDLARIGLKGFSAERFASSCAAFIRSGYPVLIVGNLENAGLHAVCAVGFRSCAPEAVDPGEFGLQDANIPHLYIHDDNLGPNIRFRVRDNGPGAPVMIQPDSPPSPTGARPDPLQGYPSLTPHLMLVAAHNDLRTSPDTLHGAAIRGARLLTRLIDHVCRQRNLGGFGITVSARYIMLADYVTNELWQVLHNQAAVLSRVRLALAEKVRPMSLHLGVIRIGMDDGTLLADVLYDTTDSDRNHPAFAFLYYQEIIGVFMRAIENTGEMNFGTPVPAC